MFGWVRRTMRILATVSNDDTGHAMVFLLLTLGAIMAFAVGMYITSEVLVEKIKAQNAADAAALAGSGVLADSLDLLAYLNWIRSASYLFGHWGSAARHLARTLAKQAIRQCSHIVNLRAAQIGLANGSIVVPLHNPRLGARENGIGNITWYTDTLRGRIGNRFVRVAAAPLPQGKQSSVNIRSLTGVNLPSLGVAEAIVHGKGLGLPKFRGGLGRLRGLPKDDIMEVLEQTMAGR